MQNWLLWSFVLTMVLTPTIFMPLKFMDGYLLPQFGIAAIGISISLILYLMNGVFDLSLITILAVLYFFYLTLTCSWSTVQHNSIRDMPLVFAYLIGFIIANALFNSYSNILIICYAVFVVAIFTSIYGILQKFCIDPLFPERLASQNHLYKGKPKIEIPKCFQNKCFRDSRVISTLGNTNFAAGFFLSVLPFLMFLSFQVSLWFLLSVLIVVITIFLTESRAGVLSLIGSSIFFILLVSVKGIFLDWILYVNKLLPMEIKLILIMSVVVLSLHVILNSKKLKQIKDFLSEDNPLNAMLDFEHGDKYHPIAHLRYRIRYIKAAFELILRKPLQGYGLRTYRKEVYGAQGRLNQKDGGKFLGEKYQTPQPREVHNDFIENFVEGGVIGGFLFILIIGIVFYNTIQNSFILSNTDFLTVASISATLLGVMINAMFFFPFRLASSSLYFFVALAMLNSFTNSVILHSFNVSIVIILFTALALIAFIWESVIKPNAGNYYFTKHNFAKYSDNKEKYLMKALKYCPRETIFRTHLMLGYTDLYPEEAEEQAETMRQHYDGMTPAWVMAYNSGMSKSRLKQYKDALKFFAESLFYYPSFQESRVQAQVVEPLSPLKIIRRYILKKITGEGETVLNNFMANVDLIKKNTEREMESLKRSTDRELQANETNMLNVILAEKVRLMIPEDWPFDFDTKQFYAPREIPEGKVVLQAGPTKTLILGNINKQ